MRRYPLFSHFGGDGASAHRVLDWGANAHEIACDASAFRKEGPEIVRKLLARGHVWISKAAIPELQQLRDNPEARDLCGLIFSNNGLVDQIRPIELDPDLRAVASHYVRLLAVRKRMRMARLHAFVREHGREPTSSEREGLWREVRELGPRVAQLSAKFGESGTEQPADESVVVESVLLALSLQRDVIVLAQDHDVLEQFYKFTWLLRDDFASDLLAQDIVKNPSHYPQRHRVADHPGLGPLVGDPETSFLVSRPQNLDYLIEHCRSHTRGIRVMQVREGGNEIGWIGCQEMLEFLRAKSARGRNTEALGPLNAYIRVPLPKDATTTLPVDYYGFFLQDKYNEFDEVVAGVATRRSVSVGDTLRAIVDCERVEPQKINANIYRAAMSQHHGGEHSAAIRVGRQLLGRSGARAGQMSAVGRAQTLLALAQFHLCSSELREAARLCDEVVRELEGAKRPELIHAVALARMNGSFARQGIGEGREALKGLNRLELDHIRSATPRLAQLAQLASFNRPQILFTMGDRDGAVAAYVRLLVHLDWPPRCAEIYELALLGLCRILLDLERDRELQRWCEEAVSLAMREPRNEENVRLFATVGMIVSGARASKREGVESELVNLLVGALAQCDVPLSEFDRIARHAFPSGQSGREVQRVLAAGPQAWLVGPGAGPRPVLWLARSHLFWAHVLAGFSRVGVQVTWFLLVRNAYRAVVDPSVQAVVREADRQVVLRSEHTGVAISRPKKVKHSVFDQAMLAATAPDGSMVRLGEFARRSRPPRSRAP